MPVLAEANAQALYNQSGADLMAVFALRNVAGNDTLDVATLPISPTFQFLRKAVVFTGGGSQAALAAVAGTVVTIPASIPVNSSGYLVVTGC